MNELFRTTETKSPRLKWLDKHGIWTQQFNAESIAPDLRWVATSAGKTGTGPTEDDAIVHLAKRMNIKLWNES